LVVFSRDTIFYYLEVVLVHQKGSGVKVFKGNSFWLQPLFSLLPKLHVESY